MFWLKKWHLGILKAGKDMIRHSPRDKGGDWSPLMTRQHPEGQSNFLNVKNKNAFPVFCQQTGSFEIFKIIYKIL